MGYRRVMYYSSLSRQRFTIELGRQTALNQVERLVIRVRLRRFLIEPDSKAKYGFPQVSRQFPCLAIDTIPFPITDMVPTSELKQSEENICS